MNTRKRGLPAGFRLSLFCIAAVCLAIGAIKLRDAYEWRMNSVPPTMPPGRPRLLNISHQVSALLDSSLGTRHPTAWQRQLRGSRGYVIFLSVREARASAVARVSVEGASTFWLERIWEPLFTDKGLPGFYRYRVGVVLAAASRALPGSVRVRLDYGRSARTVVASTWNPLVPNDSLRFYLDPRAGAPLVGALPPANRWSWLTWRSDEAPAGGLNVGIQTDPSPDYYFATQTLAHHPASIALAGWLPGRLKAGVTISPSGASARRRHVALDQRLMGPDFATTLRGPPHARERAAGQRGDGAGKEGQEEKQA